ncbi:MAG: amino acid ABC transporter substrate-binding protein [Rubrobacter sp.]|nr:amino acid ABC transporter substrate-binding protein [Rubrobacter sp.]
MKGKAVPLLLAVVVALLVVATTGCGLASEEEADSGSSEEPIVIGGSLPLSGTYGETGAYVLDGYEAWADEVNSNGGLLGRTVELSIQDDRSDPSQAVSLLQRAINQEDVDLLSGGYPGDSAAAQMSIAEQSQMVYVSMGGHLQSFEQGFEYSFGAPPLMGQWWYDGFFDWLDTQPREQWPETAALMSVNNPVGDAVREGSVRELEERGIEVVMDESYDLPLASAESLVTRAMQADADLFFANGFFEDGVQTVEAIETVEYRPRAVLQGVGTLVPSWEEELGEGGNFVFSGTAMHPDLPFEGVDRVNQLAEENYGTPKAPPYFMFGYAWMQTLQAAVEGAGSLDQDAIRDWLRNNEISTIGGTFGLDERGLPEQYQYLIQVQDGSPTLVWPEDVQTAAPVYPLPE